VDKEQRAAYVAALIRERDGYLAGGKVDRAAEVDAHLRDIGEKAAGPVKRAQRRVSKPGGSR
jgi:hypothetical protein